MRQVNKLGTVTITALITGAVGLVSWLSLQVYNFNLSEHMRIEAEAKQAVAVTDGYVRETGNVRERIAIIEERTANLDSKMDNVIEALGRAGFDKGVLYRKPIITGTSTVKR